MSKEKKAFILTIKPLGDIGLYRKKMPVIVQVRPNTTMGGKAVLVAGIIAGLSEDKKNLLVLITKSIRFSVGIYGGGSSPDWDIVESQEIPYQVQAAAGSPKNSSYMIWIDTPEIRNLLEVTHTNHSLLAVADAKNKHVAAMFAPQVETKVETPSDLTVTLRGSSDRPVHVSAKLEGVYSGNAIPVKIDQKG